mmetsp:Transcript_92075/g.192519  ORF Transcript_92075/g.192519 Transcript_92075/m.192519 type:complete len:247 (-) Transcript_92075:3470-4210(-)
MGGDIHMSGDMAMLAHDVAQHEREAGVLEVPSLLPEAAHAKLLAHAVPEERQMLSEGVVELEDLHQGLHELELDGAGRDFSPGNRWEAPPLVPDLLPFLGLALNSLFPRLALVTAVITFSLLVFFLLLHLLFGLLEGSWSLLGAGLLALLLILHLLHIGENSASKLQEEAFLDVFFDILTACFWCCRCVAAAAPIRVRRDWVRWCLIVLFFGLSSLSVVIVFVLGVGLLGIAALALHVHRLGLVLL